MDITLPPDEMTVDDKIRAMETLWDDLCRTAEEIPSPQWHGEILKEREKRLKEGKEGFTDWEKAKNEIQESLQ
jgi:hypothetical protein